MTMDFYLRMSWIDPRIYLPNLFSKVNPEAYSEGIEISKYVRNPNTLNFWLPDVVFYQSTTMDVIAELIKVLPNGSMYWSRHILATFAQPQMSFKTFPLDKQNFSFVLQSYAFDNKFISLTMYPTPVDFNYDTQQSVNYVQENQIWSYESSSAYIVEELLPSPTNPTRTYSTCYINMRFSRQSLAIVFRMALPVTIFLVIVGSSFWADINKRIDITLQILLVVAALYLTVGQVIPLVGYLTTIDEFVTTVFCLLTILVIIHFATYLLDANAMKHPLNMFHRDFIVYAFRTMWIPLMCVIFVLFFDITEDYFLAAMYFSSAIGLLHAFFKLQSLRNSFITAILLLRFKAARIEIKQQQRQSELQKRMKKSNSNHPDGIQLDTQPSLTLGDETGHEEEDLNESLHTPKLSWLERLYLRFTYDMFQMEESGMFHTINEQNQRVTKQRPDSQQEPLDTMRNQDHTTTTQRSDYEKLPDTPVRIQTMDQISSKNTLNHTFSNISNNMNSPPHVRIVSDRMFLAVASMEQDQWPQSVEVRHEVPSKASDNVGLPMISTDLDDRYALEKRILKVIGRSLDT